MTYDPNKQQLTDVLQRLYRRLGGVVITLTDGSESLAIDTKMAELLADGNVDDFLNGGTLIVIEDFGGLHAAPEGEIGYISDYDSGTTGITVNPALTSAMGAGDKVMYVDATFPVYDMVEQVNDALKHLKEIPVPDESITIVEGQTVYDLPVVLKGEQLLDVQIQTSLVAGDEQYIPVDGWGIVPSAGGTIGKIVLPYLPAGYKVRIIYSGIHPRVSAWSDPINEFLHPDLVHAVVFAFAIQWKNDANAVQGAPDDALLRLEQKAWSQFDRAMIMHPAAVPPRRIQGMPHWAGINTLRNFDLPS